MGQNLFFYGTLRDMRLLETVMGAGLAGLTVTADTLEDHAVFAVAEGPFPTLLKRSGAQAEGLLVQGLTDSHIARLDYYEGGFDYDLVPVTLRSGARAQVYMCAPDRWCAQEAWLLETWQREHGEMSMHAAREVMSYHGIYTRDEISAKFPRIRARAASKTRAARSRHGRDVLDGTVTVRSTTRSHLGFYALDTLQLHHTRFDGTDTPDLEREVFITSDAALVLPYDPKRDCVLVVEQMRLGPLGRGDRRKWQWEPVAGLIDPGETPEQAAHREAVEEAGVEIRQLLPVGETYPSPGNSSEFFYSYVGLSDLPDTMAGIGGVASEGEDIRSHILPFDDLLARTLDMDIANAPLVMITLWLARHRGRLRSQ